MSLFVFFISLLIVPQPTTYNLQTLQHTHIKPLLDTKHIIFYTRYTDDKLIIYNTTQNSLGTITHRANNIHNNLELCPTPEQNNRVSFLDLEIIRNTTNLEIIYTENPQTQTPPSAICLTTH